MEQIEITVTVNNTLEEIDTILKKQNFKLIRRSRIEDKYMTQHSSLLSEDNIIEILKTCVLIRFLNVNNKKIFKKITYKNKKYKNNTVISEEKINVNIDDIEKAEQLFLVLGFENIVNVNYDVIVYEKDGFELAFQNVEGLGLLLEYESRFDYSDSTDEEILQEKNKMLREIRKLNISIGNDYDIKKAQELILKSLK